MRALYMCCVLFLAVARFAAAAPVNPYQVTNWDRETCQSEIGNQYWDESLGACLCSAESNSMFDPRADDGQGSCLSEAVWEQFQEVFEERTEPISLPATSGPLGSHTRPYHADADGDGYSDEWDTDDSDPNVNPGVIRVPVPAAPVDPEDAPALPPETETESRDDDSSEEVVTDDPELEKVTDEVDESAADQEHEREQARAEKAAREAEKEAKAERQAEKERQERQAKAEREEREREERERKAREEEARREAEEIEKARAEQAAREAERQAELDRQEREAAAKAEEERRQAAEEDDVVTKRERELELDDDEDYFADDDDDNTFDPEFGMELVDSEDLEAGTNLSEGIDYDHGYHYSSGSDEEADPSLDIDADPDGDEIVGLDDFCPDKPGIPSDDMSLNGCPAHMHPAHDDDADADAEAVDFEDLPEVEEGPTETAAERRARLKAERDAEKERKQQEREAEQERKKREREAEQERRARERKLDDYANRLASIEWDRGHISYRRYQGNEDIDTDNDGLPDDMDLCPEEPEDFDHFVDESGHFLPLDGCPDEQTGYLKLAWDGDGDDKRFFSIHPAFTENWEGLGHDYWFEDDDSYTSDSIALLHELALVIEAYDLKVEIKGRSVSGADQEEKFANRQIVGKWSRLISDELTCQCQETGLTDCGTHIFDSAATGYSGLKHNTIIISFITH